MKDRLQKLSIGVILLMVVVECAVGLLQTFDIAPSCNDTFRMTGTFKNPGPFGGFVAVGLAIVVVMLDRCRVGKKSEALFGKIILLLVLSLGVIVLPASMSRAAWLALLVSLSLYALIEKKLWNNLKKRPCLLYVLLLSILIFSFVAFTIKQDSALGRIHIWNIECRAIANGPMLGYGRDTFLGVYGDTQANYFSCYYRPDWTYRVAGAPEYAFNEYLKIGVEYGIPIMILFISLLLFLICSLLKQRSPLAYGMIAFSVFAFFSYPLSLWQFRLVLSFAVILAISNGVASRFLSLFFIITLATYASIVSIPSDIKKRANENRWLNIEKQARSQGYTCDALNEYKTLFDELKGSARFIYAYGMALRKNHLFSESNMVLKYGTMHSADPMFYNAIGDNYKDLGEYDKAEEAYIHAHNMVPDRLYPLVLQMELYVSMEDYDRANEIGNMALMMPINVQNMPMRKLRYRVKSCLDSLKNKVEYVGEN